MSPPSAVEDLFLAALEKGTPEERAAFLDDACKDDPELRQRVERLLRAHPRAGDFLEQPVTELGPTAESASAEGESEGGATEGVGSHVGPYKLLQKLGEGGMGAVWVAEQTEPVKRRVALKLVKPGMDSAQVLRRFEAERQALALMDHTHIAKVLDAGTTPEGRPYFVMELVKGVPITRYCDELHLPIRERLELFVPVCQAIQHAHQKGIIHRDIKPSNVLVAMQDGKPVAKVIDFGVAKALHQRLTDQSMYTEIGQVVGTLEYMSPEQAELSALDIDTRADVYALGVLLYELLTGTTPLDRKRLRSAALTEMLRIIKEEEPPRPSTRLTQSKESIAGLAALRRTEPAKLTKAVRGDLDWIVMKCLEKDRTRRYETASGLAREVERYLHDEPVEACPPSAGYRLRKFARKHRAGLVTAGALAALLLLGTAVSTWQAVRATRAEQDALAARDRAAQAEADAKRERDEAVAQRRRADDEAAAARAVNEFLQQDLLGQADVRNQVGDRDRNPNVTARELLDRAARAIEGKFVGQEATEGAVRLTLGNAYLALAEYAEAQKHLERALALRMQKLGPGHPDTLTSMNSLAALYQTRGRSDEAERLYKQALEGRRAALGADDPGTLESKMGLAAVYHSRGRHDEAEPLFKQALEGFRVRLGPDQPGTFTGVLNLAASYQARGRFDEAERLYQLALDGFRARLGTDHPATLLCLNCLAALNQARGRFDEAERFYKQALEGRRAQLGPGHPDTLASTRSLALLFSARGRYAEAEPLLRQVVAEGKTEKQALDSPSDAGTLALLALSLLQQQKYAEAEPFARESLALRARREPDAWTTFNTRSLLGGSLLGQQRYAEAEPLLLQGYEGLKQREAQIPAQGKVRLAEALERLVQLYDAVGPKEKADEWRKKLEDAKAAAKPPANP